MLRGVAVVAIVCALSLLASDAVDAAVWRVPVKRRIATTSKPATNQYSHANQLTPVAPSKTNVDKHADVWTPSFPQVSAHATQDTIFDRANGNFVAQFTIGTPPQPVWLDLYIGGSDVHVLNHKLDQHEYYDHTKSSTYRANGTRIVIGNHTDYETRGFVSSDTIVIPATGSSEGGLQVSDVSFIELVGPDRMFKLFAPHEDGSIGLGPHPGYYTGLPPVMRTMITQGLLDQPIAGVLLSEWGAHLTFGGVHDPYTDGDITYFTETRGEKYGWWLPLSRIAVNGEHIIGRSERAVIDDGLCIEGPPHQIKLLERAVGVRENGTLPCDASGPNITVTLGSFELTLTALEYVIPIESSCYFAFAQGFPTMDYWRLGIHFVERVYMVLDYGETDADARLGLAHLKHP